MQRIEAIRNNLTKASLAWALKQDIDLAQIKKLRHETICLNHKHYLKTIPLYRKLALEDCIGEVTDIETIERRLMLDAGIFKSYEQSWLDDRDFSRMTQWLSGIYHRPVDANMSGVGSIDAWTERLAGTGVHVVYSSGTSGSFSFVPRDIEDWETSRAVNMVCLSPQLAGRIGGGLSQSMLKTVARLMSPETLARMVAGKGLPDYDAAFLGFRQGRMGNQALIAELAPLFRRHYFLYDIAVSGDALRCLRRGARTEAEQQLVAGLRAEVIGRSESNYLRLAENIRKSAGDGQKVFIFGAPYQFKELCQVMTANDCCFELRKGSLVLLGGGWKSFTGEELEPDKLAGMITDTLGISPPMVMEGYSMTETNALMLRCECGRFHIPPVIEPAVFDEELNPVTGDDVSGAFGFLDPLAVAYPGFIISGDHVRMINGKCDCGLSGPAITEIGRLPGSEIKGCGGIMGSMKA